MYNNRYIAFFFSLLISLPIYAQESAALTGEKNKLSYALGVYFSQSFVQQNLDLEPVSFTQAIRDVLTGAALKLNENEIQQLLMDYQQRSQDKHQEQAQNNLKLGQDFLEKNAKRDGVTVLASGLQYEIITVGSGVKPDAGAEVTVHYHGTLIDGTVFDSSYQRGQPVTLSLSQVIHGWQEALVLMPVGSKWRLYIPSDLAYGERGAGNIIGPNATLLFDVELVSIP